MLKLQALIIMEIVTTENNSREEGKNLKKISAFSFSILHTHTGQEDFLEADV